MRVLFFFFFSSFWQVLSAQTFHFTQLPTSAKSWVLGGVQAALPEPSALNFLNDPSNPRESFAFATNLGFHSTGQQSTTIAYRGKGYKTVPLIAGFQYLSYGQVASYDEFENYLGILSMGSYAFSLGSQKSLGLFTLGSTLNLIGTQFGRLSARGLSLNAAATMNIEERNWLTTLSARNLPLFLSTTGGEPINSPASISLASSYQVPNSPFTLVSEAVYLEDSGLKSELEENRAIRAISFLRMGLQVRAGNALRLLAGYNFLQRSQFVYENYKGLAGLGFGLQLRLKKYLFTYGFNQMTAGLGTHQVSLQIAFPKLAAVLKPETTP